MSVINIVQSIAEFAALIPAAIMCILPVRYNCKIKTKLLIPVTLAGLTIISVLFGFIRLKFSIDVNILLFSLMLILMIIYFLLFNQKKLKLWYIFISVTAMFSFSGLSSYIVEAFINQNGENSDLQTYGLIVQWIIIFVFFIFWFLAISKIRWLMNDYHLNSVWKFVWLVPAFISAANIMLIPEDYSVIRVGRVFEAYIVMEALLLLMYILFQVMLYIIVKVITDKTSAEQQSQILSIQAAEYKNLKNYIENTSKLRHDFLHIARTACQLAKNNDNTALIRLLDEYGVSIENSHSKKIFCKHDALNAIIGYYYEEALKNNIRCEWKVIIENNVTISDIDLCSVIGNILDNAIHGCMTVEENKRHINVSADTETNGDIYIVATNSFDGTVKKINDKYISTKKNGNGIGLESIKATVKKYNGYVNFYNDKQNFYIDIMLKQNTNS